MIYYVNCIIWSYYMENYYLWLGAFAYIFVGLGYIRIHRTYIDFSLTYSVVGAWIFIPIYLLISDFFNSKNVISSRDIKNRPFRAIITKNTKFVDERNESEKEGD